MEHNQDGRLAAALDALAELRRHRAWLAAVPIILVNTVAFLGQFGYLRVKLPWPLAGQLLVAVTLESIAVYYAWQAHLAAKAHDSALRLRLAAYGLALVIGAMNYSHYCLPGWRPTVAAVTFGLMSAISPWMWSAYSRRESRPELKAQNLIEAHAVRLGLTRWTWHPIRSTRVMSRATWAGVTRPAEAIRLLDPPVSQAAAPQAPPPASEAQPPWEPELAAAQDNAEEKLIRKLVQAGHPVLSIRAISRHPEHPRAHMSEPTKRRDAREIRAKVLTRLDGHDGRVNGS